VGHREQLIDAARRLLKTKGYARITARDLVAESGTNLGSIGYHFGSKAELLNTAIGVALEEWTEQVAEIAMAEPVSPIERGFKTWSAMVHSLPEKQDFVMSFMEGLAQARDPVLREQFARHYRRCRARVAELVAESIGESPEDPRCSALASFVIAMCDGLAVQSLVDPGALPSDEDFRSGMVSAWSSS
jgi:AcrR family transcriptional regulator